LSDDGSFGVTLTAVGPRTFFVFRIKVGDEYLGDGEAAIEWTSVNALSRLRSVDDPRVDPDRHAAQRILDLLTSSIEEELHDRTLAQFGEAMDSYDCHAYLWGDEAVMLFRPHGRAESGDAMMARLSAPELAGIAAASAAAHAALDASR
jgi:hypothetical protein